MEIIELVEKHAPITGEQLAKIVGATRPSIRSDLALLVMLGYIDAKPKVGYFIGKTVEKQSSQVSEIAGRLVKDVMGLPVVLRETATVSDAVVALFLENVGSVIVVDGSGALAGVVSRKDLLKVTLGNAQAPSVLLSMVMTRYPNVITVSPDDNVHAAMQKMIQHQVDGLPVVQPMESAGGSGKVETVGRITKTTITRLLFDMTSRE